MRYKEIKTNYCSFSKTDLKPKTLSYEIQDFRNIKCYVDTFEANILQPLDGNYKILKNKIVGEEILIYQSRILSNQRLGLKLR